MMINTAVRNVIIFLGVLCSEAQLDQLLSHFKCTHHHHYRVCTARHGTALHCTALYCL